MSEGDVVMFDGVEYELRRPHPGFNAETYHRVCREKFEQAGLPVPAWAA
jgi:hypothetical protein